MPYSSGRPVRRPDTRPRKKPVPTARAIALKALSDVIQNDAYASEAIDRALNVPDLKDEDRRLATNIFYTAVENRLYITWALGRIMEKKPDPAVNDILHISAAQLLFLSKVPDHAVVNEAVKLTRAKVSDGVTGFVNAVLHKLIALRDSDGLALPDKQVDPVQYLSLKCSLSEPVAKRLIDTYGIDRAEAIAAWKPEARTLVIRPNRKFMDEAAFGAYLDRQGIPWERGTVQDAFIVRDAGNIAQAEGYRKGDYAIQGQSAMLAAQAVEAKPGMQILDACAAPGGKTCLMAERMAGAGRLYAWDVHPHRVELIRAALRRMHLEENVRPTVRDAAQPREDMRMTMDAVLVDAPCSGIGVIADKPDIKYRHTEKDLAALPVLQKKILEACADCVKIGGLLVYATCTILPEENEQIVSAFLEDHPGFVPETKTGYLPEALRESCKDGMLTILPDEHALSGFFIARLRRKGV